MPTLIKSAGADFGAQVDVPHLIRYSERPDGRWKRVQLKVGRMPTLLGLEVIETYATELVGGESVHLRRELHGNRVSLEAS